MRRNVRSWSEKSLRERRTFLTEKMIAQYIDIYRSARAARL